MAQKTEKLKWKFTGGVTWDETFTAGENLSAKQYFFVSPGSVVGEVKLSTGASNPVPLGVLQNTPNVGEIARVRVMGYSQVVSGPAASQLTYGAFISSASNGRATYAGPSGISLGRWMNSPCSGSSGSNGSNGATGSAFINCFAQISGSLNAAS